MSPTSSRRPAPPIAPKRPPTPPATASPADRATASRNAVTGAGEWPQRRSLRAHKIPEPRDGALAHACQDVLTPPCGREHEHCGVEEDQEMRRYRPGADG